MVANCISSLVPLEFFPLIFDRESMAKHFVLNLRMTQNTQSRNHRPLATEVEADRHTVREGVTPPLPHLLSTAITSMAEIPTTREITTRGIITKVSVTTGRTPIILRPTTTVPHHPTITTDRLQGCEQDHLWRSTRTDLEEIFLHLRAERQRLATWIMHVYGRNQLLGNKDMLKGN